MISDDTSMKLSSRKKSNYTNDKIGNEDLNLNNLKKDYEELMKKYAVLMDKNQNEDIENINLKKKAKIGKA